MTYPPHVDTRRPLPPIRLDRLHFRGADRVLPAPQLWGVHRGPLQ